MEEKLTIPNASPAPVDNPSELAAELAADDEALDREIQAFEALLPSLLQTKPGLYVAVYQGQVIDEDADEIALARRIERTHRHDVVLMRRVTTDVFEEHLSSPESWQP